MNGKEVHNKYGRTQYEINPWTKQDRNKQLDGLTWEKKTSKDGKEYVGYEKHLLTGSEDYTMFGYNPATLSIYLALAGYKPNISGLAKVLGITRARARSKYWYGQFRRYDIQTLIAKLNLSMEQVKECFFNGLLPSEDLRYNIPDKVLKTGKLDQQMQQVAELIEIQEKRGFYGTKK